MNLLESAIALAVKAHVGQVDKGGHPYILHPLQVMLALQTDKEQVVGVLHDVLEDTWVTEKELREIGCDDEIVTAIQSVTRRDGESYQEFVRRAKCNPIGRNVKIEDIKQNMQLSRIKFPTERDLARIKRYEKALRILQDVV